MAEPFVTFKLYGKKNLEVDVFISHIVALVPVEDDAPMTTILTAGGHQFKVEGHKSQVLAKLS